MSGVRMTARVHLVTAQVSAAQNLIKCCNRAGLHVVDIVLEPLASSEAVLAPDECALGAALVDIGGGTTDLAVFQHNAIRHTAVLGLGGNHLTNDVAYGLRTPFELSEQIKRRYGCANRRLLEGQGDLVLVPGGDDRPKRQISRKQLAEILEPRVEEMLSLVRAELEQTDLLDSIPCGIILTGGCSSLEGLPELAAEIFEAPIRRGLPRGVGGLGHSVQGPELSTGVGLALWGAQRRGKPRFLSMEKPSFRRVLERMRSWLWSHPE